MKLLVMRHGEAVDEAPGMNDGERWLTAHGRKQTRAVAEHLVKHSAPATVWTSPLVRATQTAEIVVSAAGLEDNVSVVREIATGDITSLIRRIGEFQGDKPLILVGHEPSLSTLVMTLLHESRWPGFKKSAVCALELQGERPARFEWMLLPKHLRVIHELKDLF
jgi:phosphohistidine phosphatase